VDAEPPSESRLVTPNTYALLGTHVVTSPGSYGALEGGQVSVRSLTDINLVDADTSHTNYGDTITNERTSGHAHNASTSLASRAYDSSPS